MDPKELIAALGVIADPNASDEEKAAALDKLSAYFNSLLDSSETEQTPETSTETETTSETGEGEGDGEGDDKDKPSKEMASALAQIKTLTERLAKMEKASALGRAPRAAAPTILPRTEPPAPKDPVVSMIETAERNTIRNLSK